jgi:dihydrofolate reductase
VLTCIVVAAAQNDVIGDRNALPWRLPDDLKRFKALTIGKPVLMGRKTYESIGKPLPDRPNLVMSRQSGLTIPGCTVVTSLDQALDAAHDITMGASELMVIGGAELYAQVLARTDVIYLTRVHAEVPGDTRFPSIVWDDWNEEQSEYHPADERHAHAFSFLKLTRSYVL